MILGRNVVLTYADLTETRGKTSADSDVVEVRFLEVVSNDRVVQAVDFVGRPRSRENDDDDVERASNRRRAADVARAADARASATNAASAVIDRLGQPVEQMWTTEVVDGGRRCRLDELNPATVPRPDGRPRR